MSPLLGTGSAGKLTLALAFLAIVSGIATYVAFTAPGGDSPRATRLVEGLLIVNLVLLLALACLVVHRLVRVWLDRRRGSIGSRLHVRLVVLFSLIALIPTLTVAILSGLIFNFGMQNWFSDRVRTAVTESQEIALSYLEEHRRNIGGDILAMANDLNFQGPALLADRRALDRFIEVQTLVRSLSEAVVFESSGRILGRSQFSFSLSMETASREVIDQARGGNVVYLASEDVERIRALVRLNQFVDAYLLVGRFVDPRVMERIEQTETAVSAYQAMEQVRGEMELLFALIFAMVALVLLFAAILVGLNFATRLSQPIAALATAADRVRAGDLTARVEAEGDDEIGILGRTFNRMTRQLETQRSELVNANAQIDERRRFIEAVLGGVSAGVVGLDGEGRIRFPNQSASRIMDVDLSERIGQPIEDLVSEMGGLLERSALNPGQNQVAEIEIHRQGRVRTLLVRAVAEAQAERVSGYVVTFDDITALISAQRQAAWSDVARRLAHEIKNPLTPIQLSAERLRRRYLSQIESDSKTFSDCIDTIIRQVDDIGAMINEFSAFARMPAPVLKAADLCDVIRHVAILQKGANPGIRYDIDLPDTPVSLLCDERQVAQAVTNLMQNAADSVGARMKETGADGTIRVTILQTGATIRIEVSDDGLGLPDGVGRDLTDPYVTTRAEGTGLGLAIVKKIMEDHGGEVELVSRQDVRGARISLVFPADHAQIAAEGPASGGLSVAGMSHGS